MHLAAKADRLHALLAEATDINSIRVEMKAFTGFIKPAVQKHTRVHVTSCRPASSICEEKRAFRSHFADQLGGVESAFFGDLADVCVGSLAVEPVAPPDPNAVVEVLPGIHEVASAYRGASEGAKSKDILKGSIL